MRSLNRLKWLHAFEAAARHGSFTGAAQELGVTPAAVGQLVRALEEWVGHPLLSRTRSGKERLTLVSEAQAALLDITEGLDKLDNGLKKLRGRRARQVIVITASQVLMMNWLMARLNKFSELHPNIDLRLDIADRLIDLVHGEADIGLRCGPGNWAGLESTWLMDEEAVIVCSPSLLSQASTNDSQWLAGQRLIYDETPHPGANFPDWETVLHKTESKNASPTRLVINSTAAAIQASLSGQGVMIVRKALVQLALKSGQLIQLLPEYQWPLSWSYYLVGSQNSLKRPEVAVFHDWLRSEIDSQ